MTSVDDVGEDTGRRGQAVRIKVGMEMRSRRTERVGGSIEDVGISCDQIQKGK